MEQSTAAAAVNASCVEAEAVALIAGLKQIAEGAQVGTLDTSSALTNHS